MSDESLSLLRELDLLLLLHLTLCLIVHALIFFKTVVTTLIIRLHLIFKDYYYKAVLISA